MEEIMGVARYTREVEGEGWIGESGGWVGG